MRKIFSALDIGSNTIKLVVGEFTLNKLNILCAVKVPSYKQVMAKMSNPLTAFKYFIDYFLDRPETESEQEQA